MYFCCHKNRITNKLLPLKVVLLLKNKAHGPKGKDIWTFEVLKLKKISSFILKNRYFKGVYKDICISSSIQKISLPLKYCITLIKMTIYGKGLNTNVRKLNKSL